MAKSATPSELSRRQIVFDWLMQEKGYWGGEQEVARVDELLASLDAVSERGLSVPARMTRSNTGLPGDAEWEGWVRGWNACIDQMEYNMKQSTERNST